MPKFSIIIPVYNVAPYLRECLDSVLAQTFTDWEAICVDDGSTDESGAILDEYAAKDTRFRMIHQTNAGVGHARNVGLDLAKGNWVCFLDADDIWHGEFLSDMVSAIAQYPDCKLIRCGKVQYRDGEVCDFGKDTPKFDLVDLTRTIPLDALGNHYFWEHAFHRDLIGSVRFPRYIRGEDRVFFGSIVLTRCDSIVVSEAPRYGYRQRSGSAMNSIPSVQVLKDEMEHRRDIVLMIEASDKQVEYARSWWLERFFTDQFGMLVANKSSADSIELWNGWLKCVREMKDVCGLSTRARLIYRFCSTYPYRSLVWLLARAIPWYMMRGVLPRASRKLIRLLGA